MTKYTKYFVGTKKLNSMQYKLTDTLKAFDDFKNKQKSV